MGAKLRRGVMASAVAAVLVMVAAPTAWAEQPTPGEGSSEMQTLGEAVENAASAGITAPDQIAAELSLPADGPGSLITDEEQRVAATVQFQGEPSDDDLSALSSLAEVTTVNTRFGVASIFALPSQFTEIGELPGVTSVSPSLAPTMGTAQTAQRLGGPLAAAETPDGDTCGPVPIEADGPLRSAEARKAFGVDGTGVTVGIISDTFDRTSAPTSWDDDVASGALPGPGNPCGRLDPVEVVGPVKTGWSSSDEGRAMTQLVHGIAPGAKLLFADTGNNMYDLATSVEALADAGADIIVDDVAFAEEPYFQQGPLSVTIEAMREKYNISYFTAAGNSNEVREAEDDSWQLVNGWRTDAYRGMECPDWVQPTKSDDPLYGKTIDCMAFKTADGDTPYNEISYRPDTPVGTRVSLWGAVGEPMFAAHSPIQLRAYLVDDSGGHIHTSTSQRLADDNPTFISGLAALPNAHMRLVLVREIDEATPATGPAIWFKFGEKSAYVASNAVVGDREHDFVGLTVSGHGSDGSSIGVAALSWDRPQLPEEYSSLGPSLLLFGPAASKSPAAPLPAPLTPAAPAVSSVDATQTTFFPVIPDEEGKHRFGGTSAAAPNAAAVAALAESYNPAVRGRELEEYVLDTASLDLKNPLPVPFAEVFGVGRVDAYALLNAVPEPEPKPEPDPDPKPQPDPDPEPQPDTEPRPSPIPDPEPNPGPAQTNDARSQQLSQTGSDSMMPWIIGGSVIVLLGAATVSWAAVRRRTVRN